MSPARSADRSRRIASWYFVNAHTGGSTQDEPERLLQPERRRSGAVAVCARLQPAGYSDRTFENASGRVTWQVTPRNKVSGFWDAQALCRTCTGATPGLPEPARVSPEAVGVLGPAAACVASDVVVAGHEPAAPRSGLWRHVLRRRQLRARTEPHARSDSRRRTVRERLRGERQHSGTGLPIAGLQRRPHRLVPVEGVASRTSPARTA